jgi:hypothetical protein
MTVLGAIGGLHIPNVGWLYTVGPNLVAAIVEGFAVLALGQAARKEVGARITPMKASRGPAASPGAGDGAAPFPHG